MSIKDGSKVSIEYTLKVDGLTVDSTEGTDPLSYTHGENQIISGLEAELTGLSEGDSKSVTVGPEDGYGPIDEDAHVEVPKDQIPEEAHNVGTQLVTQDEEGNEFHPVVKEVKDETVVLDFNHPLAGKTLIFDVKVVGIE